MAKRKSAKKAAKKAAAPKKKKGFAISEVALARSAAKPRAALPVNPFTLPQHPPGVVPNGSSMAQDGDIGEYLKWAGSELSGAFSEGVTFLGYSYLSELAQRPEYRRIVEVIATEMTRKWIKLKGAGGEDQAKRIEAIEKAMTRLKVRDAFRQVAEHDGFFGRGHIYIDLGTTDDREELKTPIGNGGNALSKGKIGRGSLKRIQTVEAVWAYPTAYNSNDPLKPDWYKPSSWFVMGKQMHASRLLTFVGREVPDLLKPAYSFGGLAMSQMAKPYVDNWIRTRQSVSDLLHSFSVNGIKIDLAVAAQVEGGPDGTDIFRRIDFFNQIRDNRGVMALNKDEDFFNVSTPLSTLDALQAQTQEHMASVCGIPLVKLLGIQPAGLNASSEGEIVTFYDGILAYQEKLFRDPLAVIINMIQLSEFGDVDDGITFEFQPLWTMDDTQKSTIVTNVTNAIATAASEALIDRPTAMKELRNLGETTGVFSTISDEDIAEAEAAPPMPGENDLPEQPGPGGSEDPERRDDL
ncbi:MAG: DUF1073 domain-containing protein [Rhodospirillaceae bacterium]|nr:MAG: DUF1073 domain-containing protein [Rhodospirillaceae bacterium]